MVMREQVRKLWEVCFNESSDFMDLYFALRYRDDINLSVYDGEEVIAALQILPYPLACNNQELKTGYISGACTHPRYRNKGIMRSLLAQALTRMHHEGVELSALIPAETWLFDYYRQSGYVPVFSYEEELFTVPPVLFPMEGYCLEKTDEATSDACDYLNGKLKERPCCILHPQEDYRVVFADLHLSGGHAYVLRKGESIAAMAVAYPDNETPGVTSPESFYVAEIVADNACSRSLLLQCVCKDTGMDAIRIFVPLQTKETSAYRQAGIPLGMARIANAPLMLQRYAALHPEIELNLQLTDREVSANNGYYHLSAGKCIISPEPQSADCLQLTIGELTERIFAPLNPHMSLMMN